MTSMFKIELWYGNKQKFGHNGLSQRWANILGRVISDKPVQELFYQLNDNPPKQLSIGPDKRRLVGKGDFNIDLDIHDLNDGINLIEITAVDDDNQQITKQVELDYTPSSSVPSSISIDWSNVSSLQDTVHVVDGKWQKTDFGISPTEVGYDRIVALGDVRWKDFEVTVPITIDGINASCFEHPSVHAGVGIIARWKGHSNWGSDVWASGQPYFGPSPYGAICWYCVFHDEGGIINFFDTDFRQPARRKANLDLHIPYMFKVRVETIDDQSSQYSLKVWKQASSEPVEWTIQMTSKYVGYTSGAVALVSHHTACSFGNIEVKAI